MSPVHLSVTRGDREAPCCRAAALLIPNMKGVHILSCRSSIGWDPSSPNHAPLGKPEPRRPTGAAMELGTSTGARVSAVLFHLPEKFQSQC